MLVTLMAPGMCMHTTARDVVCESMRTALPLHTMDSSWHLLTKNSMGITLWGKCTYLNK